ncbi:MAG TPA: carboxyl transferase domain-containing protein [Myxococcota bacterium]|nr:carboxyl transferase domain-containing protein [Myxococcota bacterium]
MTRIQPIRRLAIANRGEAAMRCIRAVKSLRAQEDCETLAVALYTEIDRDAPFVRHADLAVAMPAPRGEVAAYLDYDGLMTALRKAGADAVWPGWGFVSEHPAFVERLSRAGIRFLGPSPEAMLALGDKIGSKHLAEEVGVPVTAWSKGVVETEADAEAWASKIGLPVVIKASAGGGGRGIRVVDAIDQVAAAFRSASSEAKAAFGDGRLFIEQKVTGGRHIEVQIAGDSHGNVLAVGCRDCSVQRRHQKVLEEAPPPGLAPGVREALEAAAVKVAKRVGYVGVGTVEFLVSGSHYFFLEMNPRLQVEHGITEELTGLDLVQIQIRIARGESLAGVKLREHGWAIEARVCAEDPDQGFLPAPGKIARFDPALGPRIRVDTGYVQGTTVPAAFDSLIAKVIATGADREEARARLAAALGDFDLLVEGGATNKGWLAEILDHADYRKGGVDTTWLDRFALTRERDDELASPALIAAGILAYQAARARARLNFFSQATFAADSVPVSSGQQIDLGFGGEQYRLEVFAIGGWRYRVHEAGRALTATLREEGEHTARLLLGERVYRILYDVGEAALRIEIEGRAFRFESQSAGQVRAAAPAMVVAVHVKAGDVVTAGQTIGLLEAMKMEVAFDAPVAGIVTEVLVRKGAKVAAGDVMLVIEPRKDEAGAPAAGGAARLALPDLREPLAPLFRPRGDDPLGTPDLANAAACSADVRRSAIEAVRDEARRALLGYDVSPARAEKLAEFLEAPLPSGLPEAFYEDLAEVRRELAMVADVARLFIRSPAASVSGELGPSNDARLRMFARRVRANGAGIAPEFLDLVRAALAHYGVESLEHSDPLERAVLRLLASQQQPELRDRLVLAMLRRAAALALHGVPLAEDARLARALDLIAGMRGLLSNAVADAAVEARYVIFERPDIERLAERSSKQVQAYLDAAEAEPTAPPAEVLLDLAGVQRAVFDRVGGWISDADPRRRAIALAAQLQRAYAPEEAIAQQSFRESGRWIERMDFSGGRVVLGATAALSDLAETLRVVVRAAESSRESHDWPAVYALELFAALGEEEPAPDVVALATRVLEGTLAASRVTITLVRSGGPDLHFTFVPTPGGFRADESVHGMHPEAARRVDLARLAEFSLERLPAPEGLYAFWGKSREDPSDERMFVLADVRSRSPDAGSEAALHVPAFEHAFFEATRALRNHLALRDPQRRLQWNRIAIYLAPEIVLEASLADRLSRKLAPATRNLGLEKVIVRLRMLDRANPAAPATPRELVIANITGSNLTLEMREPRSEPLRLASFYERKVVDARRRRLIYPYEIVRMLTGSHGDAAGDVELPVGTFEEWDLDEQRRPAPVSRPYGRNSCAVVIGLVTTPTDKVPEGMQRAIVLSDPTLGMGSLGPEECDRIVAALGLAEERRLPVEWVPVSSGARIAMDSGTENLDATARVVRRIIEFTQRGGAIHVIVTGVNVGAQSYWDSLATMLMHTRGALIMTPGGSMVLTGRAALEASGAVSAEDEAAIGGFERIMGPNGEAQYFASDIRDAYRILFEHYRHTYVVPGERGPRPQRTSDPDERDAGATATPGGDFARVGEIFDDATNPGRKRPFSMRPVMSAVVDQDSPQLERWRAWVGAETAIVWDAHLGGQPVCLIGIESQSLTREGFRPPDGPATWTGGTLFPLSSKKVARALNAASGNRPAVILANLSGFDGSPESMRKLQLEWGAEIARAVVNFAGPIVFLVVSRYHGGAYVVFSRALNPRLRAAALEGSYASVIGGGPAAAVVFARDVRARAAADPRVRAAQPGRNANEEARARFERVLEEVRLEKQAELAEEFDQIHSVQRAKAVGSLETIVPARDMRAFLIRTLREEQAK